MKDPCCFLCRTPQGVCASKYACAHHQKADLADAKTAAALEKQEHINHRARRTYTDRTGDQAAARADRARQEARKR